MGLAEAASGADPATGLQAARELRELAERLEALQVHNARQARLVVAGDRVLPRRQQAGSAQEVREPQELARRGAEMFERFTTQARQAVHLALSEARVLGASRIGTEHLLLGLAHGRSGAAADALRAAGLDATRLRTLTVAQPEPAPLDADSLAVLGHRPGSGQAGRRGRIRSWRA